MTCHPCNLTECKKRGNTFWSTCFVSFYEVYISICIVSISSYSFHIISCKDLKSCETQSWAIEPKSVIIVVYFFFHLNALALYICVMSCANILSRPGVLMVLGGSGHTNRSSQWMLIHWFKCGLRLRGLTKLKIACSWHCLLDGFLLALFFILWTYAMGFCLSSNANCEFWWTPPQPLYVVCI